MNKKEARLWAYDKAKEALTQHGAWASSEQITAEADKLIDWLLSEESSAAPLDDTLPSLKPDDGIASRPAVERFSASKIGTEA